MHGWACAQSRFGHGWSRLVTGRVLLIIYWTFIFGHDRSRPVTVQYGHMCDGKIWQSATSFVIHDTHDTSHSIIHEKGSGSINTDKISWLQSVSVRSVTPADGHQKNRSGDCASFGYSSRLLPGQAKKITTDIQKTHCFHCCWCERFLFRTCLNLINCHLCALQHAPLSPFPPACMLKMKPCVHMENAHKKNGISRKWGCPGSAGSMGRPLRAFQASTTTNTLLPQRIIVTQHKERDTSRADTDTRFENNCNRAWSIAHIILFSPAMWVSYVNVK